MKPYNNLKDMQRIWDGFRLTVMLPHHYRHVEHYNSKDKYFKCFTCYCVVKFLKDLILRRKNKIEAAMSGLFKRWKACIMAIFSVLRRAKSKTGKKNWRDLFIFYKLRYNIKQSSRCNLYCRIRPSFSNKPIIAHTLSKI